MSDADQRTTTPTVEEIHYREECDKLRGLLGQLECSNERLDHELEAARAVVEAAKKFRKGTFHKDLDDYFGFSELMAALEAYDKARGEGPDNV